MVSCFPFYQRFLNQKNTSYSKLAKSITNIINYRDLFYFYIKNMNFSPLTSGKKQLFVCPTKTFPFQLSLIRMIPLAFIKVTSIQHFTSIFILHPEAIVTKHRAFNSTALLPPFKWKFIQSFTNKSNIYKVNSTATKEDSLLECRRVG